MRLEISGGVGEATGSKMLGEAAVSSSPTQTGPQVNHQLEDADSSIKTFPSHPA